MGNLTKVEPFSIIGISVETTNEGGQAMNDMGALWQRFFAENVPDSIPNKVGDEIYSIYTDYASDYRGAYNAILGCKVSSLDSIPEGCVGRSFDGGDHTRFVAKGKIPEAIVKTWQEIWMEDGSLQRSYTCDFEVYGPKSQDPNDAEVEIFIAVNT